MVKGHVLGAQSHSSELNWSKKFVFRKEKNVKELKLFCTTEWTDLEDYFPQQINVQKTFFTFVSLASLHLHVGLLERIVVTGHIRKGLQAFSVQPLVWEQDKMKEMYQDRFSRTTSFSSHETGTDTFPKLKPSFCSGSVQTCDWNWKIAQNSFF